MGVLNEVSLFRASELSRRRSVVLACRSSGLSVAAYCRREGITTTTFYRWRREVEVGGLSSLAERGTVAFAEIQVRGEGAVVSAESLSPTSSRVEIALSSGDRLSVFPGCDPSWLGRVVRALRSGEC